MTGHQSLEDFLNRLRRAFRDEVRRINQSSDKPHWEDYEHGLRRVFIEMVLRDAGEIS